MQVRRWAFFDSWPQVPRILMRLRLAYLDRGRDSFFAKALEPPSSHDHGPRTLQVTEAAPWCGRVEAENSDEFRLQQLWDEMSDVRRDVLEEPDLSSHSTSKRTR